MLLERPVRDDILLVVGLKRVFAAASSWSRAKVSSFWKSEMDDEKRHQAVQGIPSRAWNLDVKPILDECGGDLHHSYR